MSGSSPGWAKNYIPTTAEWNAVFAGKMDASNPNVGNIVPSTVNAGGTTQGTATALTVQRNVITVCAAGAGVIVTLVYHKIFNRSANPLLVYPPVSAQFEGLAVNAPVSLPVNDTFEITMTSSTQGYVG